MSGPADPIGPGPAARCADCPVPPPGWNCPAIARPHPRFCRLAALGRDHDPTILRGARMAAAPGRLIVRGYANSGTGYGRMTAHLVRALEANGIPVAFSPLHRDETQTPLDPDLAGRLIDGEPAGPLLHVGAPTATFPPGSIAFSMWETTRLEPRAVANLNRARAVIVPCRANRDWFADSGVTAPIHVIPLGVDPALYRPAHGEGPTPGRFVVLGNARLTGGGHRKDAAGMVAAFVDALGDRPDCRLILKVFGDCPIDAPEHPRVAIDRTAYTDAGLAAWYRRGSAFLTLSRSEGWGMTPLEAMACGVPVVGPIHSGMADYLTPATTYPVDFDRTPARGPHYEGLGDWFPCRHESAVEQLRAAHDDPTARAVRATAAAARAAEFPWARSGAALATILRSCALGAPPPPNPSRPEPAPSRTAPPSLVDPALRDRVNACPHRGPEGGLPLLDHECHGCGGGLERTACAAGRGRSPGRVTLRECLACQAD